jgi:hypothetical protein
MRELSAERAFPSVQSLIDGSAWRELPNSATGDLLRLTLTPTGVLERTVGFRRDLRSRMSRLLRSYRSAAVAESEGRQQSADFYWRALIREIGRLATVEVWHSAIAEICAARQLSHAEVEDLRGNFITEVILDTFAAFFGLYNGKDADESVRSRAYVHSAYLGDVLRMGIVASEYAQRIHAPMLEAEFAAAADTNKWHRAIALASRLVEYFPGDVDREQSLAYTHRAAAVASLKEGPGSASANAEKLRAALQAVDALTAKYASNSAMFMVTASLLHMLAVQLANGDSISLALLEAEKAATFNPQEDGIDETRKTLVELMEQRRKNVKELLAQLATKPNATLNAQGLRVKHDADVAYGLYNAFVESDEPQKISSAAAYARAATLFRRLGADVPTDRLFEAEDEVVAALVNILENPPRDASGITGFWANEIQKHPELAVYPAENIHRYLATRLFGAGPQTVASFPALEIAPPALKRSLEPFGPWLFSGEAVVTKVIAVAAVVAIVTAAVLAANAAQTRRLRADAFTQIESAAAAGNDALTIASAEKFFNAGPPPGGDAEREAHALGHYREALARRFIRKTGPPDADELQALQRYQRNTVILQMAEVRQ